ncbi:MAG: hypothetical protein LBS48_02605 [Treponema sp.]|jgi:hypothetical protein|nr:hypothetical protein [Treponema sp.]
MKKMLLALPLFVLLTFVPVTAGGSPLYSPTWGFRLDLPEDYEFSGGDGKNTFSFTTGDGACLDLAVYSQGSGRNQYQSAEALAKDVQRRLSGSGGIDVFEYRRKEAAIMELSFSAGKQMSGWGLCIELGDIGDRPQNAKQSFLLALAFGPAERKDLQQLYFSALDSIIPEDSDRHYPGPITDYSYPREKRKLMPLAGLDAEAWFYEEDAEAAQALVDREFAVLRRYASSPVWKEAWTRFYRAIYRDSYDRLINAAFIVERKLNVPPLENRDFAHSLLQWVQSFKYERNLIGSDFVNLVSAAIEGRGDCDSRALLWAVMLNQADIPAAIMVSREYSHAMGLAELPGGGAHFTVEGKQWLVAETTARVSISLIGEKVSDISGWLGIVFE